MMSARGFQSDPSTRTAFFYGTLMHPGVLARVIGRKSNAGLEMCPALLLGYTRHCVKGADFPALLPAAQSRALVAEVPDGDTDAEPVVRGTLVTGLSDGDIGRLDYFEGDMYKRVRVSVHPLAPFVPLEGTSTAAAQVVPTAPAPLPPIENVQEGPVVKAETYVWQQELEELEAAPWSYEDFVAMNAWEWC